MRFAPLLVALALALAGAGLGCVMPAGQEVAVDRRGGAVFTGNGVLLEVSADRSKCRVAVRNNALFVERRWVDCRYVHARPLL
ncbi:MAG TPA: hypothetical protein VHQ66_12920 [Myxococcota bacterium]|nr:hypothetical protein [Myxococcota bacterium]